MSFDFEAASSTPIEIDAAELIALTLTNLRGLLKLPTTFLPNIKLQQLGDKEWRSVNSISPSDGPLHCLSWEHPNVNAVFIHYIRSENPPRRTGNIFLFTASEIKGGDWFKYVMALCAAMSAATIFGRDSIDDDGMVLGKEDCLANLEDIRNFSLVEAYPPQEAAKAFWDSLPGVRRYRKYWGIG